VVKKILLPLAIVVAASMIAYWMLQIEETIDQKVKQQPVILVDIIQARKQTVNISVKAQGTVTPRTQTTLVSEVSGLITEVSASFLVGGFFNKGDVLVRIDDRNYRADVKRTQAAVASARTRLATENGLSDNARSDWERNRQHTGANRSATDLALRKPQLAEALASLEYAQADLERKRGDLQRTIIRAPYDGLVKEKKADVGQFVRAGTELAITFAVDYAEIRLPLPDRELAYLNLPDTMKSSGEQGPAVMLTAEIGGREQSWEGRLVRTEGVFDEYSRVLFAVAQVRDPYSRESGGWPTPLRIGTFVEATIEGKVVEDVIMLPRGSLRSGNRVWVVDENNTLRPRSVAILRADEELIYVESGLDDGQLVCITSLENPLPGTQVRFTLPVDNPQLSLGQPE
jgi:RND family efflux transporter MFP subunit